MRPHITECQVGFDGAYRLGFWTRVRVTIEGLHALGAPRLEVVAPDGDGSSASVFTRPNADQFREGEPAELHTLTRVGRRDATVLVRLWDGESILDTWSSAGSRDSVVTGLPATTRLLVEVGSSAPIAGLAAPPATRGEADVARDPTTIRIDADQLPTTWLGYEGVDALIVAGAKAKTLAALDPRDGRVAAISEWVKRGGQLVIACGENSAELIGQGGPFEDLAPGRCVGVAALRRTEPIEEYAEAAEPILARDDGALTAARIADVSGRIEAFAGGRAEELPLVVRATRGFGGVTLVALDLDAPQIQRWPGARRLVQRVLNLENPGGAARADAGGALVTQGFSDLAGAAFMKLGESFTDVTTTPMLALVAVAVAYLAVIGPGEYLLGKRVLGRMESAWLVFPAVIVFVGAATYAWGVRSTGDAVRVNQLEVVDVECDTGFERGFLWAHTFSPRADRYDMSLALVDAAGAAAPAQRGFVTWYGLPGRGLGGMQTPADSLLAIDAGYRIAASPEGIFGAPINLRGVRAVTARWTADARPCVRMDLDRTSTGLVEGVLTNETEFDLVDCKLLYNGWGWRLPAMPAGAVVSVDASVSSAKLRTVLMREFGRAGRQARGVGAAERDSLAAIANMIMFSGVLGGRDFTGLDNRRENVCDLSRLLDDGRPVLLARSEEPRSRLLSDGAPLDPQSDNRGVFYRFVGAPPNEPARRE